MDNVSLARFEPFAASLAELSGKSALVTEASGIEVVRQTRIELKKVRVDIEKTGKALREEAVAIQRLVISKEKELVAIIEPEEERLAAIEAKEKERLTMEARKALLPKRLEMFHSMDFGTTPDDDFINSMDDVQYIAFLNDVQAKKNADTAKRMAEVAAKERAELDARERAVREKEEAAERAANAEREARDAKLRQERLEENARIQAEQKVIWEAKKKKEEEEAAKKKLERTKAYNAFLFSHGCEKVDGFEWVTMEKAGAVVLYKQVGTYQP